MLWLQYFHIDAETLAKFGYEPIRMLTIPPEIDAHDLAVLEIFDEAAHTVGIPFRIHPACPGSPSLRKDQNRLIPFQNSVAFVKSFFHFLPVAAAIDRDAFRKIAKKGQKDILLKIISFRQIPRKILVFQKMTRQ